MIIIMKFLIKWTKSLTTEIQIRYPTKEKKDQNSYLFGNFKRIGKNISKEYITKSLNYIERLFPNWANNKYIDKYVWDVEKLHAIVRKDYDEIIRLYNE